MQRVETGAGMTLKHDRTSTRTSEDMRRIRTRCVQGGHHGEGDIWPLVPPIVQSTVYATHDPEAISGRILADPPLPTYNRDHFPNVCALEELVADLEGAEAGYGVSSGMAAISLAALAVLSQGDHLVIGADSYCDTEMLLAQELPRFGIACSVVDVADLERVEAAVRPATGMIFAETITNPGMCVADIPGLAAIANRHDIPLVIDNSFASPALCRPIEHGADLVIHSVTKYLGGHHDLSAGVVVGSATLMARIRQFGYLLGAVPGASDAALAVRGIRTLAARMAWISDSGMEVADYLSGRPEFASVRYPGLSDNGLVARMLPDGQGGVLVVEFAGEGSASAVIDFVRALRMIPYAPSLGGEITTVCYPPRLKDQDCSREHGGNGALRFSIGLEHPADIIADIEQALMSVGSVDD